MTDGDHTKVVRAEENIKDLRRDAEQIRENALAIARLEAKLEKESFWHKNAKLIIGAIVFVFLVLMGWGASDIARLIPN